MKQVSKPSKGRRNSKKDKILIAQKVCALYAKDQHSLVECLKANGIGSESTWWNWRHSVEEIEVLFTEAKAKKQEVYKHRLVERAKTSLERFIEGWQYEEVKEEYEMAFDKVKQEYAEVLSKKTVTTKMVKPSRTAVIFVLNNFDKSNFKQGNSTVNVNILNLQKIQNKLSLLDDEELDGYLSRLNSGG